MRISDNMTFDQVRNNVARNRAEMAELQNQAATQKRVTKPSDDPVSAARVLGSRVELNGNKQYMKNLNYARSFLDFTDQSLAELTEHLVRVKELALSQANDASANPQSRRVVAAEVAQIYNQIVQIGNRKLGDRFIFGGYKTLQPPFDLNGHYKGDEGEMMIHVDKDSFVAMNIPGEKIFLGKGFARDGITQAAEKQPRTIEELKRQQLEKQQKASANAQPVELRGPSSAKPGTPPSPVQERPEEQDDGVNLFSVVRQMHTALQANDKKAVQDSIDKLDAALSQVVLSRAQVGARVSVLDSALETLQREKVDTSGVISQLEDADTFEVVSDINKTESTLQATLQTAGKLMPKSLLDFVR